MSMQLRFSPASPFVRKIRIAADQVGLGDKIELVNADTNDPDDTLRRQNPLGKLPTLVLQDGTTLYDSRVIIDYLNDQDASSSLVPKSGPERYQTMVLHALADGIMDAAILQIYEVRFRPEEQRSADWLAYQAAKVQRALAHLETSPPAYNAQRPDIGAIATACMLGYLDFRFKGEWRQSHPSLVTWLDGFAANVPNFDKTRPPAA